MPIVSSKERKACERCGYVRTVKVTRMGHPEPNHASWDHVCKACVLLARATEQRRQATKNEVEANELLALRRAGLETD